MSPIRTSPDFLTLFFSYVYLNVLSLGKYIITFGYIFNVPFCSPRNFWKGFVG